MNVLSQRTRFCLSGEQIVRDTECGYENQEVNDGCRGLVAMCVLDNNKCSKNMYWAEWQTDCPDDDCQNGPVCTQTRVQQCTTGTIHLKTLHNIL